MNKRLRMGTAEIRLNSMNIVKDENSGTPVWHLTAVVNKVSKKDHVVISVLASSESKEMLEVIKYSLEKVDIEEFEVGD